MLEKETIYYYYTPPIPLPNPRFKIPTRALKSVCSTVVPGHHPHHLVPTSSLADKGDWLRGRRSAAGVAAAAAVERSADYGPAVHIWEPRVC